MRMGFVLDRKSYRTVTHVLRHHSPALRVVDRKMAQWRHSRCALRRGRPLKVRGSHLFARPDALLRDRTATIGGDSPSAMMLLIMMGLWRLERMCSRTPEPRRPGRMASAVH